MAGDTAGVDLGGGVRLELVWCPPGTFTIEALREIFAAMMKHSTKLR
jgi:hypothetical protein